MILDISNHQINKSELILDLVSKPFGIMQRLKLKEFSLKNVTIDHFSTNFSPHLNDVTEVHADLELRSFGIVIKINQGLKSFFWIVPYHSLDLDQNEGVSIHCNGRYIQFKNKTGLKRKRSFFDNMLEQKEKCEFLLMSNIQYLHR